MSSFKLLEFLGHLQTYNDFLDVSSDELFVLIIILQSCSIQSLTILRLSVTSIMPPRISRALLFSPVLTYNSTNCRL